MTMVFQKQNVFPILKFPFGACFSIRFQFLVFFLVGIVKAFQARDLIRNLLKNLMPGAKIWGRGSNCVNQKTVKILSI